jgi:acyl dehydratase
MSEPTLPIAALAAQVGKTRVSEWVEVTQAMIATFADATGDHQFIHVDPERAAQTPFGGTIAHGFLTLSLYPMLKARTPGARIEGVKMGVNYGGNKVRFIAPVPSGSRVRGRFTLLDVVEKHPGVWQITEEYQLELESGKTALVAEWIAQIFV